MSEVRSNLNARAWGPPTFPTGGRLPNDIRKVSDNYNEQTTEENRFRQQTDAKGQKQHSPRPRGVNLMT